MRTRQEIEEAMQTRGFPEMNWLWRHFLRRNLALEELDPVLLDRLRDRHMGFLVGWPPGLFLLAVMLAAGAWPVSGGLFFAPLQPLDGPVRVLMVILLVYLICFGLTTIYRSLVLDWKAICAEDLAHMLGQPDYRQWLMSTPSARQMHEECRALGVNEYWDNPEYTRAYLSAGEEIETVEAIPATERIRQALKEVLGSKQDRVFAPGRFFEHLKDKKKSVSRFVKEHQEALTRSRELGLTAAEGIDLLGALQSEMLEGSAGHAYLEQQRSALAQGDTLPAGAVVARIWQRDPWVDLTHARDFFSSASLRGDSWKESLERRTKGMLGPFGYLRNPAMTCLDFSSREGRSVRARLAVATVPGDQGQPVPVLFVDAVEGRFDIKPKIIQRALEDYAIQAGFAAVAYYAFPLNRVPRRVVNYLAGTSARRVSLDLSLLGANHHREYLDAFGLPLEPFEYAHPRGRVIAYLSPVVAEAAQPQSRPASDLEFKLLTLGKKGLLPLITTCALIGSGWVLYRAYPPALGPTAALLGSLLLYDSVIRPRFRLRLGTAAEA